MEGLIVLVQPPAIVSKSPIVQSFEPRDLLVEELELLVVLCPPPARHDVRVAEAAGWVHHV